MAGGSEGATSRDAGGSAAIGFVQSGSVGSGPWPDGSWEREGWLTVRADHIEITGRSSGEPLLYAHRADTEVVVVHRRRLACRLWVVRRDDGPSSAWFAPTVPWGLVGRLRSVGWPVQEIAAPPTASGSDARAEAEREEAARRRHRTLSIVFAVGFVVVAGGFALVAAGTLSVLAFLVAAAVLTAAWNGWMYGIRRRQRAERRRASS